MKISHYHALLLLASLSCVTGFIRFSTPNLSSIKSGDVQSFTSGTVKDTELLSAGTGISVVDTTESKETIRNKRVYLFNEGDKSMVSLLGGKGANLAQMSTLGLPVPPGFIITTQVAKLLPV
jgi:hypothetical protein